MKNRLRQTVTAEVRVNCPFSIAHEYAMDYLKLIQRSGDPTPARAPLRMLRKWFNHFVRLRCKSKPDDSEPGRSHDLIHFQRTASALLPGFYGNIRFRIDAGATRVMIDGHYTARFGVFGKLVDSLIGIRVATAGAHRFAKEICAYLESRERTWLARYTWLNGR